MTLQIGYNRRSVAAVVLLVASSAMLPACGSSAKEEAFAQKLSAAEQAADRAVAAQHAAEQAASTAREKAAQIAAREAFNLPEGEAEGDNSIAPVPEGFATAGAHADTPNESFR